MKKNIAFRCLFLAVIGLVWYFVYPEHLYHQESIAFFAHTSDYYNLYHQLPRDILKIIGNYLAQFYQYLWLGACLQVLFLGLIFVGCDIILYRLFRNVQILWVSFIPITYFAVRQLEFSSIDYTLKWVAIIWGIALLIYLLSLCKFLPLRFVPSGQVARIVNNVVSVCFILLVPYLLITNEIGQHNEKLQRIEHSALEQKWNKVLEEVPANYQNITKVSLRYFLLALSETGQLGDKLLNYPIDSPDTFYFVDEKNLMTYRFNSLFYWHFGLPNEAIRYAFQESQNGRYLGISFGPVRKMVDWYMLKGDKRQAEYYLNLLSYSTCHDNFIKTRKIFLNQTPKSGTEPNVFFTSHKLLFDASYLIEHNPKNMKTLNYILCCLLLDRNIDAFYDVFKHYWPLGERIPGHYEEVLLMAADKRQISLEEYGISKAKMTAYEEFKGYLMHQNLSLIDLKFKNTFWRYVLVGEESTDGATGASPQAQPKTDGATGASPQRKPTTDGATGASPQQQENSIN